MYCSNKLFLDLYKFSHFNFQLCFILLAGKINPLLVNLTVLKFLLMMLKHAICLGQKPVQN